MFVLGQGNSLAGVSQIDSLRRQKFGNQLSGCLLEKSIENRKIAGNIPGKTNTGPVVDLLHW